MKKVLFAAVAAVAVLAACDKPQDSAPKAASGGTASAAADKPKAPPMPGAKPFNREAPAVPNAAALNKSIEAAQKTAAKQEKAPADDKTANSKTEPVAEKKEPEAPKSGAASAKAK